MLSGLAPRRRALVLGLVGILVLAAAVVGIRVALAGDPVPDHVSPDVPGTVVLVPGYGGSQAALDVLADRLRHQGRTATVVTLPENGNGDLTGQADALDAAVRDALRAGAPSVDLVGYSAGGVVVRLWVKRSSDARATRRVVTLGAPLHGTNLAAVGSAVLPGACPAACQQLAPGSSLLAELDAAPLPPGLPWLSVWTNDDETVRPPDSARLSGAVNVAVQDICPDATVQHGQLPTDPLVTGLILRALNGPALTTAPGPADCSTLRASNP
jgi:triacylglycerol esterase/lipase EstA (alpha/beta hydrolase family)